MSDGSSGLPAALLLSSGEDLRQDGRRRNPYPVQLPLGDASDSAVEVQVLLACEQVVQRIHLGTVADVDALFAALHNVHQAPGGKREAEAKARVINWTATREARIRSANQTQLWPAAALSTWAEIPLNPKPIHIQIRADGKQ